MKGIVTTQQMELTPERIIFSGEIPKLELKKYLLYWDFIDFPKVNGIGPNFNNDEETKLLFEQGFLKQTRIGLSNGIITVNPEKEKNDLEGKPFLSIISEYMRRALIGQWAAVEHHCKNGFKCSIAQANITLNVPPELSKKEKIAEIELYNCLPYPQKDVNIYDILEFKIKREAELTQLRFAINKLTLEIIKSPAIDLAKEIVFNELKQSISALHKVFNESNIQHNYTSVKILLKTAFDSFIGFGAGVGSAKALGFSAIDGGLIGIAGSLLNVIIRQDFVYNTIPKGLKDFAYLYYQRRELK